MSLLSKRKSAFTLVEVIFAAAILGIVLTGMLACVSRCLAVIRASRQYNDALAVIGLAEVIHPLRLDLEIEDLEVSDDEDIVEGYVFSRTIEEEEDEAEEDDGLFVVTSRVTWKYHGQEKYHEVVQYLYNPDAESDGTGAKTNTADSKTSSNSDAKTNNKADAKTNR